jgi:hypothetical protein
MKKIFFLAFIGLNLTALNAQNVGLNLQNIKPKTTVVDNKNSSQDYAPKLRLPKVDNPVVKLNQIQFYSQINYQQLTPDKSGFANHYKLMNANANLSASDIFAQNLINAALYKLFKWN